MAARKNSTKRKMSVAANSAVSQNNIVECSEEMSDIIKRITVIIEPSIRSGIYFEHK